MRQRGFTLVEMLVVLAILGLLAAISIPLYINSLNRTRQTRTMANMRSIAAAWEARAADQKSYNAAGVTFQIPARAITYAQLDLMLSPTYIRQLPRVDGWNHPLEFAADRAYGNRNAATLYSIRALGRDGQIDKGVRGRRYTVGPIDCFDCDIVFSNGQFMTWPEGEQR
jgi:type II secretion system protein G